MYSVIHAENCLRGLGHDIKHYRDANVEADEHIVVPIHIMIVKDCIIII